MTSLLVVASEQCNIRGPEGSRESARISESIIGMKIRPFVSYIKWLGELGSVGYVLVACSVLFTHLIPRGHFFFQNGTLHISHGI